MKNIILSVGMFISMGTIVSCEKWVKVDPPSTNLNGENIFSSNELAISAVTGLYSNMGFGALSSSGSIKSLGCFSGLYTDELAVVEGISSTSPYLAYYKNVLSGKKAAYGGEYWAGLYRTVVQCNILLKGIAGSEHVSEAVKRQLRGELLFNRALHYYYLVGLYGKVAWVTSSDFSENLNVVRIPEDEVLGFLVTDLLEARELLSTDFLDGALINVSNNTRFRPTTYVASVLLTKVYLLQKDWKNAELEATRVISNTALFSLDSLNAVFLHASKEAIWQQQSVIDATREAQLFALPSSGPTVANAQPLYLNPRLVGAFEQNDRRKELWIGVSGTTSIFYYAYKYKVNVKSTIIKEASTVFRLADVYLNRAEARAQADKLDMALEDLNLIRLRASIPKVVLTDKYRLLDTILHERQVELFSEYGNRFLDLKRFNKIDEVMTVACEEKGVAWKPHFRLFPLTDNELSLNKKLQQTPGY